MTNLPVQFKSSDSLISRIKEDFSSFTNSGLVDQGKLYHHIKYILDLLGAMWYIRKEVILTIDSYKTELPEDFVLLESAYRCTYGGLVRQSPGILLSRVTFDKLQDLDMDVHRYDGCSDPCCVKDTGCVFNKYEEIMINRGEYYENYHSPVLLQLGNVDTKRCCTNSCANLYSNCVDTISINQNKIFCNFKEGNIYLTYEAFPLDEETGLPLIPNNSKIEKCIEDYLKLKIIENIVVNKEADLAQLLTYYKQNYRDSLGDAQTETKLPTFYNMVKSIRTTRHRLDTYYQIEN